MFRYALKRIFYSILIMGGVLILTFVLFRLAAGDPATTVLGKNPSPMELEEMRSELGSDKPLFFGRWKHTELYSSASFAGSRTEFAALSLKGDVRPAGEGLNMNRGAELLFRRNFELPANALFRVEIHADGPLLAEGKTWTPSKDGVISAEFSSAPEELRFTALRDGTRIRSAAFQRPTKGLLDSQAADSFREILSFRDTFPYVSFLNFGNTLQTREPIRTKLWHGMLPSLLLMLPIFFGELILGIVLAMFSCIFRGRFVDRLILFLSVAGMSISYLALIIFGQWFLAYYLNLFPVWGWGTPKHLLLPVVIGIISGTGGGVRFYRTVFLDEMNKEYLRTAVAKGASPFTVYFRHLLKNAMIPILTRASTVLPFLFTGSLLLETFFGIPGLGYEGVNALNDADLQMLKALVILSAFLFVVINLITDLLYAWADPRVRVSR